MVVYTSPSVPPLEGKGWLRTENARRVKYDGHLNALAEKNTSRNLMAVAEKNRLRVPRYQKVQEVDGALRLPG